MDSLLSRIQILHLFHHGKLCRRHAAMSCCLAAIAALGFQLPLKFLKIVRVCTPSELLNRINVPVI